MTRIKKIITIAVLTIALLVVAIPLTACDDGKPYDVVIEIYNPYTDELMAWNTNTSYDYEIINDKIEMIKSDPRLLKVKYFWVDKKGNYQTFDDETLKATEKSIYYSYLSEYGWTGYYNNFIRTDTGEHEINANFNYYAKNPDYKRAQFSFVFNVTQLT